MSKITKYMSKISRDVIFSEKKKPAGMYTHRTGVGGGIGVLGGGELGYIWGGVLGELIN